MDRLHAAAGKQTPRYMKNFGFVAASGAAISTQVRIEDRRGRITGAKRWLSLTGHVLRGCEGARRDSEEENPAVRIAALRLQQLPVP